MSWGPKKAGSDEIGFGEEASLRAAEEPENKLYTAVTLKDIVI